MIRATILSYVALLEARAKSDGGKVDEKAMAAQRRWFLGDRHLPKSSEIW